MNMGMPREKISSNPIIQNLWILLQKGNGYDENIKKIVPYINGYLINSSNVFIMKSNKSISNLPIMISGNKPVDGGNLILIENEKNDLLAKCESANKFIKKFIGATEFINNTIRYCLWIEDENLNESEKCEYIKSRINNTRRVS